MYIIDKNKDFYDYYSYIYGKDKEITYDRRGSTILNDEIIAEISKSYPRDLKPNDFTFVILEIGNIQYIIQLFDFIFKDTKLFEEFKSCKMKLMKTFRDNKHYYDTPISIRGCRCRYRWDWNWIWKKRITSPVDFNGSYEEVIVKVLDNEIKNPILANTQLTSLLNPEDIWIELQTYISSLNNDKDISIPMTDVERAEIHGFDKKTSFRHPVK